ncbi:tyrosine-type recombinase/integrase [Draconibacterium orientale]|uniref:site-specific integrase n=1 Tax=Draconibacterium orientale TaxID=1168034 RepID=UPI0029BFE061|nr:tyrosine-type recombinase/integrase [Draconibacterium orientale]
MLSYNVKFKLRATQPGKPTPINLLVYFDKTQFKYSTRQKILPEYWNSEANRPYNKKTDPELFKRLPENTKRELEVISFRLDEFNGAAKTYFEYFTFQREQVTPEKLKEKFDADFRPDQPKKEPKTIDLNTFIDNFIKDIENGKRLTPAGERYKLNTIKNYKSFKTQFDLYQQKHRKKIQYKDITIDFYHSFLEFFNKKDYHLNTIGRHIKTLKVIVRAALDEGHHTNEEINRKQFKTFREQIDTVYLTQKEIDKISELDLSEEPHLDRDRDIFLVGIYTAQRFSDYHRIKKENIRTLENGQKVIELHQQKTKEKVTIPIKPELLTILKKYNYNLPKTYEQKVNTNIKTVCKRAKIKDKIQTQSIQGGMKVTTTKPKHKLITTHTARRTGATLMYLAGIPTISAMKITGHKTEKQFLEYIKVTKEENAQNLALHPYFNTNLKIVK